MTKFEFWDICMLSCSIEELYDSGKDYGTFMFHGKEVFVDFGRKFGTTIEMNINDFPIEFDYLDPTSLRNELIDLYECGEI